MKTPPKNPPYPPIIPPRIMPQPKSPSVPLAKAKRGVNRPDAKINFNVFIFNFLIYLNQSLIVLGQPTRSKSAKGAPQLAQRSTNSKMESPAIGRIRAVQKPQNAIHKIARRIGLIRIKIAKETSNKPINHKIVVAV